MLFFLGKVAKTCCYLLKLDMEYWINKSGTLIGSAFILFAQHIRILTGVSP